MIICGVLDSLCQLDLVLLLVFSFVDYVGVNSCRLVFDAASIGVTGGVRDDNCDDCPGIDV